MQEAKFNAYQALPDKELVHLLQESDNDAWEYIFYRVVLPVIAGCTFGGMDCRSIMKDKGLDEYDAWSELYIEMIEKKKLEQFRFRAPLIYWMRYYVKGFFTKYCKKNPSHLSEIAWDDTYTDSTTVTEISEVATMSFSKLWSKNPMRAYVYLLKNENCYSSSEIAEILGLGNSSNVDQYYARAKKEFIAYVNEFSGETQ